MVTETAAAKPANNRIAPPSALRRHGSQLGIISVGLVMWLSFVIAAPAVFTNVKIYAAFAQTTPQFGIIALALTFVVITGEIDLSFPSIMALGTAAFCIVSAYGGMPWYVGLAVGFGTGAACGLINGLLVAKLEHSLAGHHHRHLVPLSRARTRPDERHRRAADGRAVPADARLFREPVFGFPVQTLWMVIIAAVLWVLLNRTRFGAHVFLVGDNPTSARLMGINVVSVKTRAFMLVGVMAVFAGILTSIYGYYFWPTTGDGFLLNTIASVFLGGTSVFGGTGSVIGTFVASYIIGAINAGIVSAGINAFYTQLAFGFVIVISVVLQIVIERRIRRQSLTGR